MCSIMEVGQDGIALEALEREITELASHIHAATCRWLCLVAEFDRRGGWAGWSCRSCAEWVSWRCGIAPVAAREHVRVARRLQGLPRIREAFAAGRLSYSKVRAICRVEEIASEQELLDLARHTTAAQLERLVRAYRGVVAVEEAARGERVSERWVHWSHADDGSLLLNARLPAEEGAVVLSALEAARDRLAEVHRAGEDDSAESSCVEPSPGRIEAALSDDSADSPREDRLSRPIEAAPADDSAESPLTAEQRCADALVFVADSFLAREPGSRSGGDRFQVVVHMDAATLRTHERGERCELSDGIPLAAETARRLACDAAVVPLLERAGKPLSVGRKTRSIPPALRRALQARDGGCRFPGCNSRRFVDAHHIEHWARGGTTELSNLVQLCRHHHRLLHEGGYSLEAHPDGRLTFRRPDGRRIPACPPQPRGRPGALRERRPGHSRVDPEACAPICDQRLDLELAVEALIAYAPIGAGAG